MKRWTKDEEEFLKVMVEGGDTYKEIANELERTLKSVKQKSLRLQLDSKNAGIAYTTEEYKYLLSKNCPTQLALGNYVNARTTILHKCLICDAEYYCLPTGKLKGWKHCNTKNNAGGIPKDKPAITYLVHITKYDLYKIGITSKTVKQRMQDMNISEYESIIEITFDKGQDAMYLEKIWIQNVESYKINTGLLKQGNTETFKL